MKIAAASEVNTAVPRRQTLCSVSLVCLITCASAQGYTADPSHEYENPAFDAGHAYDGTVPGETIDLFSGGLRLDLAVAPLSSIPAFASLEKLGTLHYSSKIYRQHATPTSCDPTANFVDDEHVGLGWRMHFGRFVEPDTLELPDGSRQYFLQDTQTPGQKISREGWVSKEGLCPQGHQYRDFCSPGPDRVCLRFKTSAAAPQYQDIRNGQKVYHAFAWYIGHPTNIHAAEGAWDGQRNPVHLPIGCRQSPMAPRHPVGMRIEPRELRAWKHER